MAPDSIYLLGGRDFKRRLNSTLRWLPLVGFTLAQCEIDALAEQDAWELADAVEAWENEGGR